MIQVFHTVAAEVRKGLAGLQRGAARPGKPVAGPDLADAAGGGVAAAVRVQGGVTPVRCPPRLDAPQESLGVIVRGRTVRRRSKPWIVI